MNQKIAVNTRYLRKHQLDGIGWFSYNSLKQITRRQPEIEFHFFFDGPIDEEFLFADNIIPHTLFPPAKHAVLNLVWSEIAVKSWLKRLKPDLYFSPDGMLCLGWDGPQHAIIHDIAFFHNPLDLKWSNRQFYNRLFPRYARKACRLATVSAYSKTDIVEHFQIDPDQIDVVYCGANDFFQPISKATQLTVRDKYSAGFPYFVFVGTLSPRKNILGLMKAFDKFKAETGFPHKLLIAGKEMYQADGIRTLRSELKSAGDIELLGRLPNEELNCVLGAATALVFVPFAEGFGIPLVEAMQCKVPIICSNRTAMPEIVGDAALLVDPQQQQEIAAAMTALASDADLATTLIANGEERLKLFSWEQTADRLWDSLTHCL